MTGFSRVRPPLGYTLTLLLGLGIALSGLGSTYIQASAPPIRFETPFASNNPISHQMGAVNSIIQDQYGFMWLGAENGAARYDGRKLTLYQSDPQRPRSLPDSYISQMVSDQDGVLWFATEGGLARYHIETDDFSAVTAIGETFFKTTSISSLALAADNSLYVGTARGFYIISPDRQSMEEHFPQPPIPIKPNAEQIRSIAIDRQERVWLGTAGMGVAIFDPQSENFEYLLHDPDNANSLGYNSVRAILHDQEGQVWLGTYGGGIDRLNPETGEFTHFTYTRNQPGSPQSNVVWDIIQDSEGIVWFALDQGGLARFDEQTQSFQHYQHRPYDPTSVISNQLRVVYEDRNKDIWLGATPSGVSFYNRSTQVFRHYTTKAGDPQSLSHNSILKILEANDGTLWIGTEGGLNALNPETGKFQRYLAAPDNPRALAANAVLAIEEDTDGQLWVGTWAGGLHRLDPATGHFQRYRPDHNDPGSINSDFVWDILRDRNDNIWIATETGGLNRYHRETDSFSHYVHNPDSPGGLSGNFLTTMLEDSRGRLWLGGYAGVNIFDPQTETFIQVPYGTGEPNATNSNSIKALAEDSQGRVWVGTNNQGVNIYDPETGTFSYMGVPEGLPSPTVSQILEDHRNNIWMATANGLVRMEPEGDLTVYGQEEGVAGSHFNREANLRRSDNHLYFGSSQGITRFHPDELGNHDTAFPVRLTRFRVFNREVPIGTDDSPLEHSILVADQIMLRHKDTMFSFDFAALSFRNSQSMHYSYRLDGFDHIWHNIGRQATATYTNIEPGNYTFRIRASTNGEDWIEGQSVAVTVLPPPWRTWWAYSLYLLLILLALYLRREHVKLRNRAETYKTEAITDPLTQLYNRLGIAHVSDGIFANRETRKGSFLMLMDIDHFKPINDRYGHDAGDQVLVNIATLISKKLRHNDYLGRWGGEEFILLCATQTQDNAWLLAEKIRAEVAAYEHTIGGGVVHITISIGIAEILPDDTFETATKRADIALYQAKEQGRNRATVASL